jgi:putative hemolysin
MTDGARIARDIPYAHAVRTPAGRAMVRGMEMAFGRPRLLRRARGYADAVADGSSFWEEMATRYGIALDVVRGDVASIPAEGPVVVVANHPYGILDGLTLSLLLSRRRTAFKVLANDVFLRAPDLADVILPVSFDAGRDAQARNLAMRRAAQLFLASGGAVGVFPGGTVSTPKRPFGEARDPRWKGFTARLILASGVPVVPVHFDGANSRVFQIASHLHYTLRVGLLIREFRARIDRPVRISIGDPIPSEEIARFRGDRRALMEWLRSRTYALGGRDDRPGFDYETDREACT